MYAIIRKKESDLKNKVFRLKETLIKKLVISYNDADGRNVINTFNAINMQQRHTYDTSMTFRMDVIFLKKN